MLMNPTRPIPDARIPRAVLASKLKAIDKRRAEIEALLAMKRESDIEPYHSQELRAELTELNNMRREIDRVLHPTPEPPIRPEQQAALERKRQRDIAILRSAIRERREHLEWSAEREAAAGNHRQARIWRLELMTVEEDVCKEHHLDLALLSEITDGNTGAREAKPRATKRKRETKRRRQNA